MYVHEVLWYRASNAKTTRLSENFSAFFFPAHIMLLYQSGRSQRSLVGRVKYPTDGVACPHWAQFDLQQNMKYAYDVQHLIDKDCTLSLFSQFELTQITNNYRKRRAHLLSIVYWALLIGPFLLSIMQLLVLYVCVSQIIPWDKKLDILSVKKWKMSMKDARWRTNKCKGEWYTCPQLCCPDSSPG